MVTKSQIREAIRLTFKQCRTEFYEARSGNPDLTTLPERMAQEAVQGRSRQLDSILDVGSDAGWSESEETERGFTGEPFDGETDLVQVERDEYTTSGAYERGNSMERQTFTWIGGSHKGGKQQRIAKYPLFRYPNEEPQRANAVAGPSRPPPDQAHEPLISHSALQRKPPSTPPELSIPQKPLTPRTTRSNGPNILNKGKSPIRPRPLETPIPHIRKGRPVKPVPEYTFCVPLKTNTWIQEEEIMPFIPTMADDVKFKLEAYGELFEDEYAWNELGRDPDLDIILTETLRRLTNASYVRDRTDIHVSRALTGEEIDETRILPQTKDRIEGWEDDRDLPAFPAIPAAAAEKGERRVPPSSLARRRRRMSALSDNEFGPVGPSFSQSHSQASQSRSRKRSRRVILSDDESEGEGGPASQRGDVFGNFNGGGGLQPAFQETATRAMIHKRDRGSAFRSEVMDYDELWCPNAACRMYGCEIHVDDGMDHILPPMPPPPKSIYSKNILKERPDQPCSDTCFFATESNDPPSSSCSSLNENDQINLVFLLKDWSPGLKVCDLVCIFGGYAVTSTSSDGNDPSSGSFDGIDAPVTCHQVGKAIESLYGPVTPIAVNTFTPSRPGLAQRGDLLSRTPVAALTRIPNRAPPKQQQPQQRQNGNKGGHNSYYDLRATHMMPVELCHHEGPCEGSSDCPCFQAKIHCERDCHCGVECKRRHPGCRCKSERHQQLGKGKHSHPPCTEASKCLCILDGRECDPERCGSCGANHEDTRSNDPAVPKSSLPGSCHNISILAGHHQPVRVGISTISGYGLFSTCSIKKGCLVLEYIGEVVNFSEGAKRGMIYEVTHRNYLFDLNKVMHIDAAHQGNEARYFNGGRKGQINCEAMVKHVQGNHRIGIWSARDIRPNEELLFDYGQHFDLSASQEKVGGKGKGGKKGVKRGGEGGGTGGSGVGGEKKKKAPSRKNEEGVGRKVVAGGKRGRAGGEVTVVGKGEGGKEILAGVMEDGNENGIGMGRRRSFLQSLDQDMDMEDRGGPFMEAAGAQDEKMRMQDKEEYQEDEGDRLNEDLDAGMDHSGPASLTHQDPKPPQQVVKGYTFRRKQTNENFYMGMRVI